MRLREAANDPSAEPMGGAGKVLESDETFVGGKKKNVHNGKPESVGQERLHWAERTLVARAKHVILTAPAGEVDPVR